MPDAMFFCRSKCEKASKQQAEFSIIDLSKNRCPFLLGRGVTTGTDFHANMGPFRAN
jgi:hypothetical protein